MKKKNEKLAEHQYLLPAELESELRKVCEELSTEHNRKIVLESVNKEFDGCGYLIKIGGANNEERPSMSVIRYNATETTFNGSFVCQINDIRSMIEFYLSGTDFGNRYSLCTYDAVERRFHMQTPAHMMFDLLNIYVDMTYVDFYAVSCTVDTDDAEIINNMPAFAMSRLFAVEIPLITHGHINNLSTLATLYDYANNPQYCDINLASQIADVNQIAWIKLFQTRKHININRVVSGTYEPLLAATAEAFEIIRCVICHALHDSRMHVLDCALTMTMNDPRVKITRNFMFPRPGSDNVTPVIGYIEFEVGKNKFFLYYNQSDNGKVYIVDTATNSTFTIRPGRWVYRDKLQDIGEPIRRFLGL